MAEKNRTTVVINSRQYVVISEEETDYINGLAEHINEKIKSVLEAGNNVSGERPIVLAALNICDEYFKTFEARLDLQDEADRLKKLIQNSEKNTEDIDQLQQEIVGYSKELSKSENTIKTLEAHIKKLESKYQNNLDSEKKHSESMTELKNKYEQEIEKLKNEHKKELSQLKKEYESREQEILEMIDRT